MTKAQRDAIDAKDKAARDKHNAGIKPYSNKGTKKGAGTVNSATDARLLQMQRKKDLAALRTSNPVKKEKVTQTAFSRSEREINKNDKSN